MKKIDPNVVYLLELAIQTKSLVQITYVDRKGNSTNRKVEPYNLNTAKGEVHAFCLEKQEIRLFKLDQIVTIEAQKEKYEPRWDRFINDTLVEDEGIEVREDSIEDTLKSYSNEKVIDLAMRFAELKVDAFHPLHDFYAMVQRELQRRTSR